MMNHMEIRETIKPLVPARMLSRPVDRRGYPVPWFVTLKDEQGRWEFRVLEPERYAEAIKRRVCWICGDLLGRYLAFAIGPMCAITGTSGEPPQHLECAEFAVKACPFMLLPRAARREANKPADWSRSENGLDRNPGVSLIWVTESFRVMRDPGGIGFLWRMGPAHGVSFWREGRLATRAEIMDSVEGGLPAVAAVAEEEGPGAVAELARLKGAFARLLPAA